MHADFPIFLFSWQSPLSSQKIITGAVESEPTTESNSTDKWEIIFPSSV